jgi:hypothetical protein
LNAGALGSLQDPSARIRPALSWRWRLLYGNRDGARFADDRFPTEPPRLQPKLHYNFVGETKNTKMVA